jgi:tRNA 2-thiouridine synthesizing protein A
MRREASGEASGKASGNGSRVPDDVWDAGEMGCGELILLLRNRVRALAPGQVLRVTALDPGAREDLPAWSRLTGHILLSAAHPVYEFERKHDTQS